MFSPPLPRMPLQGGSPIQKRDLEEAGYRRPEGEPRRAEWWLPMSSICPAIAVPVSNKAAHHFPRASASIVGELGTLAPQRSASGRERERVASPLPNPPAG